MRCIFHTFTPFASDPRFERCVCGATRRADRISDNPCVQMFGRGPADATCGDCQRRTRIRQHYDSWDVCDLRHDNSYRNPQRADWEACARFEPRAKQVAGE